MQGISKGIGFGGYGLGGLGGLGGYGLGEYEVECQLSSLVHRESLECIKLMELD